MNSQCRAITRKGSRCKRGVADGQLVCRQHFKASGQKEFSPGVSISRDREIIQESRSSNKSNRADAETRGLREVAGNPRNILLIVLEKFFAFAGIVGLASIDDDFIRWAHFATAVVAAYRDLVYPIYDACSQAFQIHLTALARDILTVTCSLFAGANAHSLRLRKRLAISEAIRIFYAEYLLHEQADVDEEDQKYYLYSVPVVTIVFQALPIAYLLKILFSGEIAIFVFCLLFYFYVQIGFSFITDASRSYQPKESDSDARAFLRMSLVFLPSAVFRYILVFSFGLLAIVFSAWRLHLRMCLAFLVLFILNEIDLRYFKEWRTPKPDCVFISIPDTCGP